MLKRTVDSLKRSNSMSTSIEKDPVNEMVSEGDPITEEEMKLANKPVVSMKIALASDHAGYLYKEKVKAFLKSKKYEVKDFGTDSEKSVDYPTFIGPAAWAVAREECDRAIIFGGSGNGEAMVANRIKGVRCAVAWDVESARLSREHNDANVLSMGARLVKLPLVLEIVETWLNTSFQAGRHLKRIHMIDDIPIPPRK